MIYKVVWVLRAIVLKMFLKSIGMGSYVGPLQFLYGARKISIGRRVRVFPDARLEVHGDGRLVIKDNVSIGNNLHLACAGEVVISEGVQISSCVLITDIDHEFKRIGVPIFDQPLCVSNTYIGRNCFIGAGAKILAGTRLGEQCVVGANSVVRGEFPAYSVLAGAPARVVRRYSTDSGLWVVGAR